MVGTHRSSGDQPEGEADESVQDTAASPAQASLHPFDQDIQSHIGRQLRSVYDAVVSQPVPARFLDLLSQLEAKTQATDTDTDTGTDTETEHGGGEDRPS